MKGLTDQELVDQLVKTRKTLRSAPAPQRPVHAFQWPPRNIRRAIPVASRGLSTRRGRKAHARIVRIAARYGVTVQLK